MANTLSLLFTFTFIGDGTDTTIAINMLTGPIAFSSGSSILDNFNSVPSAIVGLNVDGAEIDSFSYTLGMLTITLTGPATADQIYTVSGTAKYSG